MSQVFFMGAAQRVSQESFVAPYALTVSSLNGPAMAVYKEHTQQELYQVYMAFTNADVNNHISIWSLGQDGLFGSRETSSDDVSHHSPALAAYGASLYIAFTGTNSHIYLRPYEERKFGTRVDTGDTSPYAPALAQFNGRLYLAFAGQNGHLYIRSTDDGKNFRKEFEYSASCRTGPGLAVFDSKLYVAFTTYENNQNCLNTWCSANGQDFAAPDHVVFAGVTTDRNPSLAAFNGALQLAITRHQDHHIQFLATTDGRNFNTRTTLPSTTPENCAITALGNMLYVAFVSDTAQHSILSAFQNVLASSAQAVKDIVVAVKDESWSKAKHLMTQLMQTADFQALLSILDMLGFHSVGLIGGADAGVVVGVSGTVGLLTDLTGSAYYSLIDAGISIGLSEGAEGVLGLFISTAQPADCGGIAFSQKVAGNFGVGVAVQSAESLEPPGPIAFNFLVTTGEEISVSAGFEGSIVAPV